MYRTQQSALDEPIRRNNFALHKRSHIIQCYYKKIDSFNPNYLRYRHYDARFCRETLEVYYSNLQLFDVFTLNHTAYINAVVEFLPNTR
jgi:hypothetical protein